MPKIVVSIFSTFSCCSWGSDWGIGGYMMVARNKSNLCGVATAASYPILKQT